MRNLAIVAALFMNLLPAGSALPASPDGDERPAVLTIRDRGERGGWLGVSAEDAESPGTRGSGAREGARVSRVLRDSPAEKAGLKEGDIIVEINGKSVADRWELLKAVREAKPLSKASIVVMRGGKRETLLATLGRVPELYGHEFMTPPRPFHFRAPLIAPHALPWMRMDACGLSLMEMNEQLAAYFEAPNNTGVLVEEVEEDSPAEKAGFKAGDVIVTLGQDTVWNERDFREALDRYKGGEKVSVGIVRKGVQKTLSLAVPEQEPSQRSMHRFPHWRQDFQWDSGLFNRHMKELGERVGKIGRELGEQMKGLGKRIREELRIIDV